MAASQQLKTQHLWWRAGFGPTATAVADSLPKQTYAKLKQETTQPVTELKVTTNSLKQLYTDYKSAGNAQMKRDSLPANIKREIKLQSRDNLKNLNIAWLNEMVTSKDQLREKMALFWHGHFASRVINIYYQELMINTIRTNALGNFGHLLKAVSKSASMLSFLNNRQNRKQHPNENFAREVMELFTLGRGNYTEQDVKEGARAFTGWSFDLDGGFIFRPLLHDNDSKKFLGKEGNFNGDDILNIILEQKQTAVFITQKIYRYLVNDTADAKHVQWLAARFYQNNYNIQMLLDDIFSSAWFYEEKNIGAIIKSPVALPVGIRRQLPMQIDNEGMQLVLQKALGQLLFYPPNVAGWPGGKAWIDSSSLMLRLRIPQLIQDDDTFFITTKQDDDVQMGMADTMTDTKMPGSKMLAKQGLNIRANIDWQSFAKQYEKVKQPELFDALKNGVLQVSQGSLNENAMKDLVNNSSTEKYIETATIALMSTPEYQLC